MMTKLLRHHVVLMALGALLSTSVLATACSRASDETTLRDDAGAPVDPTLLAFLSRARSAHHIADGYEEDKALDKAIAPLQALVDGPVPGGGGVGAPPEVREVLADTLARLADMRSQLGQFERAASDVGRGLELATETTYFRGHLFEVRGLLEERRAKSLTDKGDAAGAEEAKKRALESFEKSMSIQAEVIRKATGEEDAQ